MFKMSTIHANTMLSHMHPNDYTTAQSLLLRWRCGAAASIPSADVLSTPSHQFHGSASGRPSLDRYPRCCRPPDSKIWRIGWPHLWRAKLWRLYLQHGDSVTCTVNGMISVTSTLRHQVRDVHGTQRSKFTSMISIHLQSCVPEIIKISAFCKSYCEKNRWHLVMWT